MTSRAAAQARQSAEAQAAEQGALQAASRCTLAESLCPPIRAVNTDRTLSSSHGSRHSGRHPRVPHLPNPRLPSPNKPVRRGPACGLTDHDAANSIPAFPHRATGNESQAPNHARPPPRVTRGEPPGPGRPRPRPRSRRRRHGSGVRGARAPQPLPQLAHPPHQARRRPGPRSPSRAGARGGGTEPGAGASRWETRGGGQAGAHRWEARGGGQAGAGGGGEGEAGGQTGGGGRREGEGDQGEGRRGPEGGGRQEGFGAGARGRHAAAAAAPRHPARLRGHRRHAAARQQAPRARAQEGIRHSIWSCLALHCRNKLRILCDTLIGRFLILLSGQGLYSSLQNCC